MVATSRYGATPGTPSALDPNTQRSTGSSTSSGSSSQFQGITGNDKDNLQTLINTLLYGTATPQTRTGYRGSDGKFYTIEEFDRMPRGPVKVKLFGGVGQQVTEVLSPVNYQGTTAMQEAADSKKQVMADLTKLISQYSPEGASADSALAMQTLLQKSMEANMPAIQRSIENAGTSGGAQQALLSNDLATRAAGESALLGLETKKEYGQISANLANVLGSLSNQEDPAIKALLEALKATSTSSQQESRSQTETRQSGPIGLQAAGSDVFAPNAGPAASTGNPWIAADYGRKPAHTSAYK